MRHYKKQFEEINIPDITIEEFDAMNEEHVFSRKYERRKKKIIKNSKKGKEIIIKRFSIQTAAAITAVCVLLPAGAYAAASHAEFFKNVFGKAGRKSVESHVEMQYEEGKGYIQVEYPEREYIDVDEEFAENLIGDYVMDQPITKQMGNHTLTITSAVFDKNTMVMEFTLECKEGVNALVYNEKTNKGKGAYFSDESTLCFGFKNAGDCIYVDLEKSTNEKLYCYDYIVFDNDRTENPVLEIRYSDVPISDIGDGDYRKRELVEIPISKTIGQTHYESKEGGKLKVSAIGLKLDMTKGLGLSKDEMYDPWYISNIIIHYQNGSEYVVVNENVYNAGYSCGMTDGSYVLAFNRLINPEDIDTIKVNGIEYKISSDK